MIAEAKYWVHTLGSNIHAANVPSSGRIDDIYSAEECIERVEKVKEVEYPIAMHWNSDLELCQVGNGGLGALDDNQNACSDCRISILDGTYFYYIFTRF